MNRCGIIGGTGLTVLGNLESAAAQSISGPYGEASAPLHAGTLHGADVLFIARHGEAHNIPPHRFNYRANVWALREAGADRIIAVNAVGGITPAMQPGKIVIPHQLVDYTYGRAHTFFESGLDHVVHAEFEPPYDSELRDSIIGAAGEAGIEIAAGAVYGVTQGPRLETAAEIDRLARDGCDIVGMTAMPEAGLARELGLPYASVCVVVNRAAGRGDGDIHGQLARYLDAGMAAVDNLLRCYFSGN